MIVEAVLAIVIAVGVFGGLAKLADRGSRTRQSTGRSSTRPGERGSPYRHPGRANTRRGRGRRPSSLLVKGWNSAGLPQVDEDRIPDAAAVLGGRALGATGRQLRRAARGTGRGMVKGARRLGSTGWRLSRHAGQSASARAARRWQGRTGGQGDNPAPNVVPLLRRVPQPATESTDDRGESTPAGDNLTSEREPAGPDPELVREAKRKAAAAYADDGVTEDEVTVTANGDIIIDRRAKFPWAQPLKVGHVGGPGNGRIEPAHPDAGGPPPEPHTQHPEGGTTMSTPFPRGRAAGSSTSGEWSSVIATVADYEPDSDADLIEWMGRQTAGVCGYADALSQVYDTCTQSVGLDPSSVQGLQEYATEAAELARAMTHAHKRFMAVYQEVLEATQRGVVLPYKGRFFTGEAAS